MPTFSSVAFDVTNNYGGTYAGIRSVEFFFEDTLIPVVLANGDDCNQSSYLTGYHSQYAFFNYPQTGTAYNRQWQSASGQTTNQRIVVWFEVPTTFDKIVINNAHHLGGNTNYGAQNIKVYGSSLTAMSRFYGSDLSGSTLLFDGTLLQHVATDTADPQIVYDASGPVIDTEIVTPLVELSGYVYNESAPPDIDIDADMVSPVSELSGVTVNSADVPFVFLVQSEHPDGDKDFHDVVKNLPVYVTGDVRHVTDPPDTAPYFGESCIMLTSSFGGPSDGILYTDETDDFAFGLEDFTVDFWYYQIYPGTNGNIFYFSESPTGFNRPSITLERVSSFSQFWLTVTGPSSGPVGYHGTYWDSWTWYHLAIDRRDGVTRFCRNGVVLYTSTDTSDYDARKLVIGNNNCLIEELRVSRYSRWGGAFTPDTEPFVAEDTTVAGIKALTPVISAVVWNTPPAKTYTNGQPWINQYPFNTSSPTTIGTFSAGTDFATGISHGSSLVTDDFVYIVGGTTSYTSGAAPDPPPQADSSAVYYATKNSDGTIGAWTETTSLPTPRYSAQLFQTYRRIFLVGGVDLNGDPTTSVLTAPVNTDGTLGEWTVTYSMNVTRSDFALSVTRNRVYALGGVAYAYIGNYAVDTYEYAPINYDGTIGEWQLAGTMPQARSRCFSLYTGDKLYLLGGGDLLTSIDTDVIDVSAEGVLVGDWTTLSWSVLPGTMFVCSASRLFFLGGQDGNHSIDSITSRDITSGELSETSDFRGELTIPVFSPIVFLTKNRIYVVGGVSTEDSITPDELSSDEWCTYATTGSASFTGMDVDYALYTSVEEETAIPIGGDVRQPLPEMQSYFGYGAISYGDVVAPVTLVESITRYTEFVDGDIIAPLPEIFSLGYHFRYINTEIVAPLPVVYGNSGAIISAEIFAPVPSVYSYVRRVYFMTDIKTRLPVLSSSVSNPIAINGHIKPVHPHLSSTFQAIVNVHAPASVISGVTVNPYAMFGNYRIKEPVISSLMSNPELINSSIVPKIAKVAAEAFEVPYIMAAIKPKAPVISSFVDEGAIRIYGDFLPQRPTIHGEFAMSDDYVVIKHREDRLCRQ